MCWGSLLPALLVAPAPSFPPSSHTSFANKYKGFYSTSVPDAGSFYKSNNYQDDLAWAASWLAVRTGRPLYKAAALAHYIKHWDDEDGASVWNNYDWCVIGGLGRLGCSVCNGCCLAGC